MNLSPPSPSTSSLSDDELEAHLRTLLGTEWVFRILDDPDMPSNHAMVASKPSAATEFVAATGSTSVFDPLEAPSSPAATKPSTAARYSAAEAPSTQAALATSPKALSSPGAAPSNLAVSRSIYRLCDARLWQRYMALMVAIEFYPHP